MAETDILRSVLSQFRGDVVPHSGLCEFHSCALCREVSHHGLIAKIPLCHLHSRYYFCNYPRFKIIGKDQNKDRFKTDGFAVLDSRFVTTERKR